MLKSIFSLFEQFDPEKYSILKTKISIIHTTHMSHDPRTRKTPPLPYWVCLTLWAVLGPFGAGPAGSGQWTRAGLEITMTCTGLIIFSDGIALFIHSGAQALTDALVEGSISSARGWSFFFFMCVSMGLWTGDFWRMRAWHGHDKNPLLGETTQ